MAALAAGLTRYDGSACRRCGGTLRWTANYGCAACLKVRQRAADAAQRDELAAELRRWAAKVGAEGVHEAVHAAIDAGVLPPQPAKRSGRKRARRKPQEPVA
jgi:hypothetical protein